MTDRLVVCLSDYPIELLRSWVEDLDAAVVVADRDGGSDAVHHLLPQADVVIADAGRRLFLDAAAVGLLGRCALVIVPAVGIEGSVDVDALRRRGVRVVGAPGYNAEAVADWTIWAMLEAIRDPVDLRETGWGDREIGRELGALRIGLVGLGAIGGAVRRRLAPFGATVRYSTRQQRSEPGRVSLARLFAESDVVSLHLPLTDATRGLVGRSLLSSMPAESVLINAARGAVVDEADLVDALRAGRPARAVLDVFDEEPLPLEHPLRTLPRVRLTPHIAAGTRQARTRVRALVRDRLRTALRDLSVDRTR